MNRFIVLYFLSLPAFGYGQCNPNTIWNTTSGNAVCDEVDGVVRHWYTNSLPDHATGNFPNQGNPNSISAQQGEFSMCAYPQLAGQITDLIIDGFGSMGGCPTFEFGLATNGIEFDPIAAEFFENTSSGQLNYDWNLNPLSPNVNLGTDVNDAHVQPSGKYHYHGNPANFIAGLGITPSEHSPIIGWAADGFPMYYKYVYSDAMNANSSVVEATSCFELKSGTRPGDGVSAPNGAYDGTYVEDYEYNNAIGGCLLDQCNGRYGVTPDFPGGTYYYVMTEDFPVVPRCFAGTPDMSFSIGPPFAGCGQSNAESFCSALSVGISAPELADRLIIYPVPNATDFLNVEIVGDQKKHPTWVSVIDGTGRMVMSGSYSRTISIAGLDSGVYYIKLSFENTEITKRFVKQ